MRVPPGLNYNNCLLMKKYLPVLGFIFFISCNSHNDNSIALFNDLSFELGKGEKLAEITSGTQSNYAGFISQKKVQIPLFRYIKATGYDIYIGIPYNTSLSELNDSKLLGDSLSLENKVDSLSFNFNTFAKDSTYFCEYIQKSQNNLLYILAVTESKQLLDSLFNYNVLAKRVNGINNEK